MKIRQLQLIVLVVMMVLCIAGCSKEQTPKDVYIQFSEAAMISLSDATMKYCHYEDETHKQLASETTDYLLSYEILMFEQLSDKLWASTVKTVCWYDSENVYTYTNFVGLVDGEYKVMVNSDQIPAELKDGLDLDGYADCFKTESIEATE